METRNTGNKPVFLINNRDRLARFLVLGCNNNTFRVQENDDMMSEYKNGSFDYVYDIIEADPGSFRDILLDTVHNRRSKKLNPPVFVFALGVTYKTGQESTLRFRKSLYHHIHEVCTTPSTLMMFVDYCKQLMLATKGTTGWNNVHKKALLSWFTHRTDILRLAHVLTKYKRRNGYSIRDILRLLHPVPASDQYNILYYYMVKGAVPECPSVECRELHHFLLKLDTLSRNNTILSIEEVCEWIKTYHLAHEHIPNHLLNNPSIWKALLYSMPNVAMLRNLNKITAVGLLEDKMVEAYVMNKIDEIHNVHPIQVLIALKMYAQGHGDKGKLTWNPNPRIIQKLNDKFMNVSMITRPRTRKICCALDVSGSMSGVRIYGASCLTPLEAVIAMAMVLKKKYGDDMDMMCFSHDIIPFHIDPTRSLLENIERALHIPFGSTDISLPFTWGMKQTQTYDNFIVMTDNETNCNRIRPIDALAEYRRQKHVPECGLLVLATSSSDISIGDPMDKRTLNICGFDESVPQVIEEFCSVPEK